MRSMLADGAAKCWVVKAAPTSFKAGVTLPLLQLMPASHKLFGISLVPRPLLL